MKNLTVFFLISSLMVFSMQAAEENYDFNDVKKKYLQIKVKAILEFEKNNTLEKYRQTRQQAEQQAREQARELAREQARELAELAEELAELAEELAEKQAEKQAEEQNKFCSIS